MGFDSFGLPTENASRALKLEPAEYTKVCIDKMKGQFKSFRFEYEKEMVSTSDFLYFKWTQYLFVLMFNAGLIYKKKDYVNWDPVDLTVLANEQVILGRGERSGAIVEKKLISQWFVNIKFYQKKLLDQLDLLDWPESIKKQQSNWIGKMEGLKTLGIISNDIDNFTQTVECFIKSRHEISQPTVALISPLHKIKLPKFQSITYSGNEYSTTGHSLSIQGLKVPIIITDKVQPDYIYYASTLDKSDSNLINHLKKITKISIQPENPTKFKGKPKTLYKLKDWVISRQRKWGTPIPIYTCPTHGETPLKLTQLPLLHPKTSMEFINCHICSQKSILSPETLDTFFDSSFYHYRFLDPKNNSKILELEKSKNVDLYIGGIEHAVLHLLYSRFFSFFMNDVGIVNVKSGEPFQKFLAVGMVLGETFKLNGQYLNNQSVYRENDNYYTDVLKNNIACKTEVQRSVEKMSKSKYNGVDPVEKIQEYGRDVMRLYILYKAAPQDELVWEEKGVVGMTRFLDRLNQIQSKFIVSDNHHFGGSAKDQDDVKRVQKVLVTNKYMKNMDSFMFHRNVTLLMEFSKLLFKAEPSDLMGRWLLFLRMLYPFAPEIVVEFCHQIIGLGNVDDACKANCRKILDGCELDDF
jgi:leucyl-tRNA synthetase